MEDQFYISHLLKFGFIFGALGFVSSTEIAQLIDGGRFGRDIFVSLGQLFLH